MSLTTEIKESLENAPERIAVAHPAEIVASLRLPPGASVLDLGAGKGAFTVEFANAVGKHGRVVASDIEPWTVRFLGWRARQLGLTNIVPLLVPPVGFEDYQRNGPYDLIFLFGVYHYLPDGPGHLQALLPALRPGTGRVAIGVVKEFPQFAPIQIADALAVAKDLGASGLAAVARRRLPSALQQAIDQGFASGNRNATLEHDILTALNLLCDDPGLIPALEVEVRKDPEQIYLSDFLYERDLNLFRWLYRDLVAEGILERQAGSLDAVELERLRAANKVVLEGIFRKSGLIKQADYNALGYLEKAPSFRRETLIRQIEARGFRFVELISSQKYHDLYMFQAL